MNWSHPLWTITIKYLFSPSWDMGFWGHQLAVSPLTWQSNKVILFYLTQTAASESQHGRTEKLSFQHQLLITSGLLVWFPDCYPSQQKGDDRGWDGWMASPTWWTWWVWANSVRYWRTGRPGVLRSMGLQRTQVSDWSTTINLKQVHDYLNKRK